MRNGDYHLLICIEVLGVELAGSHHNLGAALIAILLLNLHRLLLDNAELTLGSSKDVAHIVNLSAQLSILFGEFAVLQTGQRTKTHIDNSSCLNLRQIKAIHQGSLSLVGSLRSLDDSHNLVNILLSNQQTLHNVCTTLCGCQVELSTTDNHLVTMLNKVLNHIFEVEQHRTTTYQRDIIYCKRTLQRSILVKSVQHYARHSILFEDDDDTNTLFVTLIVDIGDTLNLLLVDQGRNLLNHLGLIDHIGHLGNDDALTTRSGMLNLGACTHHYPTTTCFECLTDTLVAVDDTTCGEVGTLNIVGEFRYLNLGVVNIGADSIAHLREVVGCHIGSHTDSDTRRAIYQQERNSGRKHSRLLLRVVVVGHKVHSILVDISHHLVGNLTHTSLGITHCCCAITIHRTEVTLTVYQRITKAPPLGHTHHCVIYRTVAVGMEFTQHITDNLCTLTGRLVGVEAELVAHIIHNTTVHRLHTIAHIRQSTRNNNRHRIVDVGALHLLLNINFLYPFVCHFLSCYYNRVKVLLFFFSTKQIDLKKAAYSVNFSL